ncbi:MAG: hypothetical protein HQL41_00905 [Alphaproteobacteria bacterium]|nr:hypothetical protein [Alphaproteobacteria bacterium]
MALFFFLLTLALLIALLVGLIKPALVRQPRRGRAVLVFGGGALTALILFIAVLPPPPPPPPSPAASADPQIAAKDEDDLFARFCEYEKARSAVSAAVTREIGANPEDTLQPGDVVMLKESAVLGPVIETRSLSDEETLQALQRLQTMPAGDRIEVLERAFASTGSLAYRVRWIERDAVGFVKPMALMWMSDNAAISAHVTLRDKLLTERMQPLKKRLFEDAGLNFNTVSHQGLSNGWLLKCKQQ